MLMLGAMLSAIYFVNARFENYRHNFERFVSKLIQQPVQIGAIAIGSHGLEPVLKLQNVVIFSDAKTEKILQTKELQIGIDLIGSLFQWQVKPGLLLVRGSELNVYQDKHGSLRVMGISSGATNTTKVNSVLNEISSWLFEQSSIDLADIVLNCRLANGEVIKITDLRLKLYKSVLQHDLKVRGKVKQKDLQTAAFKANLKLHGDLRHHAISSLLGELKLDNFVFDLNLNGTNVLDKGFFIPSTGNIRLAIKNSKITTKVFRQPLLINNLNSKVFWQSDNKGFKVSLDNLEFVDNHLTCHGNGQFLFPHKTKMPTVDVGLKFKLMNLAKAKLYYPVTMLLPAAVTWLDQAFISSKVISGSIVLQGPLNKFPFDHNEGRLVIDSTIKDVYLHYDHDWPQLEKITGKIAFANRTMTIVSHSAKIMGSPTKFIKATIPDLEFPVLYVEGEIDTTSSLGLKFLRSSPLNTTVGSKLRDINLTGPMKFGLKMKMPLSDDSADKDTQVEGSIKLKNNNLNSQNLGLEINDISGNLYFNDANLTSDPLQGKLFAKPISLILSTLQPKHSDPITRINISGSAEIQDFERVFLVKLSSYASGSFKYTGLLDLHDGSLPNIFKLNSTLVGVAVELPEPFAKEANSSSKFNLTCLFGSNKLPQVNINYNDQINAALLVESGGTDYLKVVAGEVKFGAVPAKISASSGLVVSGSLNKLDWKIWQEFFGKTHTAISEAMSTIRQISLSIKECRIFGYIFNKLSLLAQPQDDGWVIKITMSDADGELYFPYNTKATIKGNFKKLCVSGEKQKTLTTFKPQYFPPLDFKINDLRYNQKRFGTITFVTEPQDGGLKINKATISDLGFDIDADGTWLAADNSQSTVLRGKIKSDNVGGLLKRKDITDTMIDGKGEANFVLKWPDSPYKPTLSTMHGNCSFNINNGRIINLGKGTENKLGFGRVLGILSLQSLPRRLSLDFSDLTKKGFSFDALKGDFELKDGNMLVNNLHIDGPVANIKAYGRIGLQNQDYDMMLSAIPQITSSIPVVAAVAGGPVIGVISLVAEKVVSTAIKKAAVYNYHVTGSWGKPEIDVAEPQN
jgi:uncharacterized protein (TIGR02099 family)